jgi:hypothetical protein
MISRLRETSKIAPHELDSLLKFVLPPLQIFNDHICPVELKSISRMAVHPSSTEPQGLKPLFFGSLDVAAEAATHKDYS